MFGLAWLAANPVLGESRLLLEARRRAYLKRWARELADPNRELPALMVGAGVAAVLDGARRQPRAWLLAVLRSRVLALGGNGA